MRARVQEAARLVGVTETGAILLGEHVGVDGYAPNLLARVTTHIHSDHIKGLRKSLREIAVHIATTLTHDLLSAMGYRVPPDKRVDASYNSRLRVDSTTVRLLPANHVPGAAQVVVEGEWGLAGYTGDFKLPGTEPIREADVLVVDATYGMPEWRRPWQEEMEYLLPDIISEALTRGPVNLYAYNGKQEEVLLLLRRNGVDAPVIVSRKKWPAIRVLERHGFRVGDVLVEGSIEAMEVQRSGWYIRFRGFSEWSRRRRFGGSAVHVKLTGWEFRAPYYWVGQREVIVSFSDHADFDQLVNYVTEAKPRLLIVDSTRGSTAARVFAEYARRRLGLQAVALPGEERLLGYG